MTGRSSPVRAAVRELRLLRVADGCASLPWLLEAVEHGAGEDLRSEVRLKVRCLQDDLVALGFIDAA